LAFGGGELLREDGRPGGCPRMQGGAQEGVPGGDQGGTHVDVQFQVDFDVADFAQELHHVAFGIVDQRIVPDLRLGRRKLRRLPAMHKPQEGNIRVRRLGGD